MINKAYIKSLFPNVTIMTGTNFYPYSIDFDFYLKRFQTISSTSFIPISMSLGLPVFLYQTVLEKEKKLMMYMRINGMRMDSYWFVNYVFNFSFYMITYLFYFFTGLMVFQQMLFTHTSIALQFITFIGWGLAQVSFSQFLSVFISKTQTATVIGYGIAIFLMAVGCLF